VRSARNARQNQDEVDAVVRGVVDDRVAWIVERRATLPAAATAATAASPAAATASTASTAPSTSGAAELVAKT
jgi:hypothetical protein